MSADTLAPGAKPVPPPSRPYNPATGLASPVAPPPSRAVVGATPNTNSSLAQPQSAPPAETKPEPTAAPISTTPAVSAAPEPKGLLREDEEVEDHSFELYGFSDTILSRYKIKRKLGSGAFAMVFLVQNRETGLEFAMKAVIKARVVDKVRLENEIAALRKAQHRNVVAFEETSEDDKYLYVLIEFCPGGELFDAIIERNSFPEATAAIIMKNLVQGVAYLHSIGVVHRDLKPENVLLMDRENFSKGVKISDFGVVSLFEETAKKRQLLQSSCGTMHYMAPEIISGKQYDHACDLWSCGVILYNLLSGDYPFDDESDFELMKKIVRADVRFDHPGWQSISPAARNLITRLLKADPFERLSANEALHHSWLKHVKAD